MHHLGDDERTMRLDAADDWLPGIGLRSASHAGLIGVALQERLIRVNAFGADRAQAAPPSCGAERRIVGATERRYFTVWPFMALGAKSSQVSMSIVQASRSMKPDPVSAKA